MSTQPAVRPAGNGVSTAGILEFEKPLVRIEREIAELEAAQAHGTRDLSSVTRLGDILVVAIGRAKFVTAEMVKPGAAVVDVGINRTDDGLVGDVDFAAVREVAGAISPVPGGVGPLTRAMLLRNTLLAAQALET